MRYTLSARILNSTIGIVLILATLSLAVGCSSKDADAPSSESGLQVVVSILPQAYLVDRITGSGASVSVLIPPGMSPHTYELTPRQMTELEDADVLFTAGVPFEDGLIPRIQRVYPSLRIVATGAETSLRQSEAEDPDHADPHHDHANDPHTWLSPKNAIVHARAIAGELTSIDPSNADIYGRNLDQLVLQLDSLDGELSELLGGLAGRKMYVYHPAWGYFTDAYGLVQVPIQPEGKDPGSLKLAQLTEQASRDSVKAIFVQQQFASQSPHVIAEAIGARIVLIDPLAYDYVENLRHVANEIKDAL